MRSLRLMSITAAVLMVFGLLGCNKKLDTDQKKISYTIGQQIGQNIKQVGLDVDPDIVGMAIADVLKGQNKMTQEEMNQAQMKLQEMMMKKSQAAAEENQKKAADNKKAADEFLEKNKTAEGVKITSTGLQYIIEKEGSGAKPSATDTVKVHYKGTLLSGEEFDSSYSRNKPEEFPVNGVIKGWGEALQLMKVGGKYKLFVPPDLGYGDRPAGSKIPPNSLLVFEVELLDVVKAAKDTKTKKM